MKVYQTKVKKLTGTDQHEVYVKVRAIYKKLLGRTKRKPYVRSPYFNKQKVFLDYFWEHLYQKNPWDRFRRLQYYACAIDLIKNSKIDPNSVQNPNRPTQVLHRFEGKTKEGDSFFVQITEDKRTNQKYFISVFPK